MGEAETQDARTRRQASALEAGDTAAAQAGAKRAPVTKTNQEWRAELDPEAYAVLRESATERPWTGQYVHTKQVGVYRCRACEAELFRSETKFESHCGWPSFWDPSDSAAVILRPDYSLGTVRTEVLCANCHSHLGHVFAGEGYDTPTDQRYCINSVALTLESQE